MLTFMKAQTASLIAWLDRPGGDEGRYDRVRVVVCIGKLYRECSRSTYMFYIGQKLGVS